MSKNSSMVIPFSRAMLSQEAPAVAVTYWSEGPHTPSLMPSVPLLAPMVATAGAGVMEAGWSMKRDASDAITKANIVHVRKNILIPDELSMILVVAEKRKKYW